MLFPCLETVVASQAQALVSTFRSYAKLAMAASKTGGQLDPKDASQLGRVLTTLKRPIEQANADIADLIALDAVVQQAVQVHATREAYLAAAAADDDVEITAKTRREKLEADKNAKMKAATLSVGDMDAYERAMVDLTDFKRIQHEVTAPVKAAALQAFDKARAAAEKVNALRTKLSPILSALDSGPAR